MRVLVPRRLCREAVSVDSDLEQGCAREGGTDFFSQLASGRLDCRLARLELPSGRDDLAGAQTTELPPEQHFRSSTPSPHHVDNAHLLDRHRVHATGGRSATRRAQRQPADHRSMVRE